MKRHLILMYTHKSAQPSFSYTYSNIQNVIVLSHLHLKIFLVYSWATQLYNVDKTVLLLFIDKKRWRKQGRLIWSPKPHLVQFQHSNYKHGRWIFMGPHSSQWRSYLTAQPALQQQPALAFPPQSSVEFIWQLKVFKNSKSPAKYWIYTIFFM